MEHTYDQARGGLAEIYRQRGSYPKVIELELENADILEKMAREPQEQQTIAVSKELAMSYDVVAYSYQRLHDVPSALCYWRKSAETGDIVHWGVYEYMRLLCGSPKESKWKETISLLQLMQARMAGGKYYCVLNLPTLGTPEVA